MRYLRKHIFERIRSERGASLMMGLMLFLVVVTVTSIALAAATSVSGRYSQLADMDRSYYNVTSAAKLFWDAMDGSTTSDSTITITRSCEAKQNDDGSFSDSKAWTMSFDDFKIDEDQPPTKLDNLTLFQILTADALFLQEPLEPSLTTDRTITLEQVEDSIDFEGLCPNDPEYTGNVTYDKFTIKPQDKENSKIEPVDVTVKCDANGTYSFVFEESTEESAHTTPTFNQGTPFRCTVFAHMSIDDSAPRITDFGNDIYRLEWVTTITWQREGLDTGGGTYGT